MITSNECWLKSTCKKYKRPDCECKTADIFCQKLFRINALYDEALVSEKQRHRIGLVLDDHITDKAEFDHLQFIESTIIDFVKQGGNIYLHSAICGNGKTAWALRLLQDYIEAIWPYAGIECKALFINVPYFLLALKDNISTKSGYIEHIKKNVLTADLVIWDEVATKALTEYEHEHLLSLINARLDAGKSNIYTSNMDAQTLQEKLGSRLYSRILGMSEDIEFHGMDKRGRIKQ